MGRSRDMRDEDRGLGRGYREEDRDRGRFGGGGMRGGGFSARDMGRYGRGYEYGGDEDRGRFDQDSREEYHRGGLMRGTSGALRAGGPGEQFGEGFWSQDQGEDRSYGTRGFGREDDEPPRVRSSYLEQRPRTGYATSPTRDMDREAGHGDGRGGLQGAYPYYEQSPELPRRQGRGPRNYKRSDERIREDICDRLMGAWMDADEVDVRVEGGEVTLTGMVKSRDEKRAIEDLAEEILGVKDVHNELRVAREQPGQEQGRMLHS
ncbi:MAG: BON domain-containing protein [Archangium sp.]